MKVCMKSENVAENVFKKNSNITQGGSYKAGHSLYSHHTSSSMSGEELQEKKRNK